MQLLCLNLFFFSQDCLDGCIVQTVCILNKLMQVFKICMFKNSKDFAMVKRSMINYVLEKPEHFSFEFNSTDVHK